jgi:hypothetical protein
MASDLVTVRGIHRTYHIGIEWEVYVFEVPNSECWIEQQRGVLDRGICEVWTGSNLSEQQFHGVPEGCTFGFVTLQRKELLCVIERALADAECGVTELGTIEALLAWRCGLVQEGLVGVRKRVAARAIQRSFREAISNPVYGLCKKRLLCEATQLVL